MCAMLLSPTPPTPLADQNQGFFSTFLAGVGKAATETISGGVSTIGQAGAQRLASKISESGRLGKLPTSPDDVLRTSDQRFDSGARIDLAGLPQNQTATPEGRVANLPRTNTGKAFELTGFGLDNVGVSPTLLIGGAALLAIALMMRR